MSDSPAFGDSPRPTQPQSMPFRNALGLSHASPTAPLSPLESALHTPVLKHFPWSRARGIAAGLLESGLEVRLRGFQSIFIILLRCGRPRGRAHARNTTIGFASLRNLWSLTPSQG